MNEELEQQLTALQDMLEIAKHEPTDEQLAQVMQQGVQVFTHIYQALYQWYLSIGAPGGDSPEQFHAWLKTVKVRRT